MSKKLTIALISALLLSGCGPDVCNPFAEASDPWIVYCPPVPTYPVYTYPLDMAMTSRMPWTAQFDGPLCIIYTPVGFAQHWNGICPAKPGVECNGFCNYYGSCSVSCYGPLF